MRVPCAFLALCLPLVASAAPPTVTLPPEIPGALSNFVLVKAEVSGAKVVKYVALDAGLNVFPSGLLNDQTATVVTAIKPGKYRLLAYSGNQDGPSEPAQTLIVISDVPTPLDPKPTPPKPTDPPTTPTPADVMYFAAVRADQNTAEFEKLMKLPAWDELRQKGHVVKDIPISELPSGIDKPGSLPVVVVLRRNADGKTWTPLKSVPMPTTDEAIRGLLK